MKTAVIISKKDQAGINIYEFLKDLENVYLVEEESIYCDDIDKKIKADNFIFATKHQSVSGKPCLLVHIPGNWDKAELGGRNRTLCRSSGYLKDAFLLLKRLNKDKKYEVSVEAVHHGPFLEKPVMFIELGSSKEEWDDKDAAKIIANVIKEVLKKSVKRYKTVIVLGGGHYNVVSNKILERTEYDISYICPKHYLEVLDEEMLKQVLEKSHNKVEMFVLDYKGLGNSKKKVIDLLNKMKLKYVKSSEILTTYE